MPRVLAALALLTNLASAEEIEIVNPRPFGYVIGDLLERRITVAAKPNALPQLGKVNGWFELRHASAADRGGKAEVTLVYQLMNAPQEVKTLSLPPVALDIAESHIAIPEWPITASPLTPEFVLARDQLGEMRPDVPPQPIPTQTIETRLAIYLAGIFAILMWLAYRKFGWRLSRQPFSRAYRQLRWLRTQDPYPAAIKIIHRAFDETAGHAVFANELTKFFSAHPHLSEARDEAQRFFSLSREQFFSGKRDEGSLDWLNAFSRNLSRLETK